MPLHAHARSSGCLCMHAPVHASRPRSADVPPDNNRYVWPLSGPTDGDTRVTIRARSTFAMDDEADMADYRCAFGPELDVRRLWSSSSACSASVPIRGSCVLLSLLCLCANLPAHAFSSRAVPPATGARAHHARPPLRRRLQLPEPPPLRDDAVLAADRRRHGLRPRPARAQALPDGAAHLAQRAAGGYAPLHTRTKHPPHARKAPPARAHGTLRTHKAPSHVRRTQPSPNPSSHLPFAHTVPAAAS